MDIGKTALDLNSALGSLLGVVRAFVIFCTNEEGYPFETSTDTQTSAVSEHTSHIFATLSNFNKLNMCGIRNPRTAHNAHATDDLRITAGGHFLVVIVM